MPSLRLSCARGRLSMTTTTKTPTTRTPSPTDRLALPSARAQVSSHSIYFHVIPLAVFIGSSSLKKNTSSSHLTPPPTPTIYPSIPRCSDFLLLPQTTPRPIPSQERHASLRSAAARPHPLTVPWVPAAAAVCSVVGRLLTMTHIHPRPVHLLYPTTA